MARQKPIILQNPLKRGYSRQTVSANISELVNAGAPQRQAIAIALDNGREAFRKRFPRKRFPAHLNREVKKNPMFKVGPGASQIKEKARGVVAQDKSASYIVKSGGQKRGVIRNPTNGRNYRKAVRLYRDFTGENPRFTDEWDVEVPDTAMQVGKVTGIMYKARVDGREQEYLHEFTGKSRPILAASADGRQLLLLGGDYKMTERGIVDGTYEIRR